MLPLPVLEGPPCPYYRTRGGGGDDVSAARSAAPSAAPSPLPPPPPRGGEPAGRALSRAMAAGSDFEHSAVCLCVVQQGLYLPGWPQVSQNEKKKVVVRQGRSLKFKQKPGHEKENPLKPIFGKLLETTTSSTKNFSHFGRT